MIGFNLLHNLVKRTHLVTDTHCVNEPVDVELSRVFLVLLTPSCTGCWDRAVSNVSDDHVNKRQRPGAILVKTMCNGDLEMGILFLIVHYKQIDQAIFFIFISFLSTFLHIFLLNCGHWSGLMMYASLFMYWNLYSYFFIRYSSWIVSQKFKGRINLLPVSLCWLY